jgi:hypothetical protein
MPSAYGIPNCVGWYQAGSAVYSDAGSTPAASGTGVAQWNDISGANNHLTQTSAGNRPVYNSYTAAVTSAGASQVVLYGSAANVYQPSYPASILFDGVNSFLNIPTSLAVTGSGCTMVVCAKGSGISPMALGTGSGGSTLTFGWFGGFPQKVGLWNGSFLQFANSTYLPVLAPMVYGLRASAPLNETRFYLGTNQSTAAAGNWLPGALTGGSVGRANGANAAPFGNFSFSGEISEAVIFSSALSNSDMATLLADMQAANHLRADSNANQVVFVGDSLTAGGPPLKPISKNYPAIVCQQSGWAFKPLMVAVPGQTIAQQMSLVSGELAAMDLTPFGKSVAVVCCGSNDVVAGRTSAQILTDLAAMGTTLQTAGYKVILATITPRTLPSDQAATLAAVNAGLRTGYSAFANALVDWAIDPRLADPTNTTYYNSDQCHQTDVGDGVKAQLVKPALDAILNPAAVTAAPLQFASFYAPGRAFAGTYGNFVRS